MTKQSSLSWCAVLLASAVKYYKDEYVGDGKKNKASHLNA